MSGKLSSDEVPQKFSEWLLFMGCPLEKIPSAEKVAQLCRGEYYMVWRSLMEHVQAKHVIRQKRLQVFCDDILRCQKAKSHDTNIIVPEELSLWREQNELRTKVLEAEKRVDKAQKELELVTEKVSSKLAQRALHRRDVCDSQRRGWLLQAAAKDLCTKRESLEQTQTIVDSLCHIDEPLDIQNKLEKCLPLMLRPSASVSMMSAPNPVACSSLVSNTNDTMNQTEEHLSEVVRCGGAVLWRQLSERRAGLVEALSARNTRVAADSTQRETSVTPRGVVARSAALHCFLSLDALKYRMLINQTQKRFANALANLNDVISGEECELVVLSCERARATARVATLNRLVDELTNRSGVFEPHHSEKGVSETAAKNVEQLDRAIIAKKEEIKRLLSSLAQTEGKIQNVKESLSTVFSGLQKDVDDCVKFTSLQQPEAAQDAIVEIRRFYRRQKEKHADKVELSFKLDNSESFNDTENIEDPKYIDELKLYLKKFKLEKNRKIVLESGEKIWISETLQSSISRLHAAKLTHETTCRLICPSDSLSHNLVRLRRDAAGLVAPSRDSSEKKVYISYDISARKEEEDKQTDTIKKRLSEALTSLQKEHKNLDVLQNNLGLWSENKWKTYVSPCRSVNGKTLKEYESLYLASLNPGL